VRRVAFTVFATMLIAGAVPAAALAHHHHHHHFKHHARFRRFGDQGTAPTSTSSSDNAGTVQSFTNGVLTITLNDGSTVSGKVTDATELECTSTQQAQTTHDSGDPGSGGSDQSSGGDQTSGGSDQSSGGSDQSSGGSDQGDDDQGEDQSSSCTTSSLTQGAVVHEASLRVDSNGATWEKVELVS
jgi:hypothetical protein